MQGVPRDVLETCVLPHAFVLLSHARNLCLTCRAWARAMKKLQCWHVFLVSRQQQAREELPDVVALEAYSDGETIRILMSKLSLQELVQSFSCQLSTGFSSKLLHNGDIRAVKRNWQGGAFEVTGKTIRRGRVAAGKFWAGLSFSGNVVKEIGSDSLSRFCGGPDRLQMTSRGCNDVLTQLKIGETLHEFVYHKKANLYTMGSLNGAAEAEFVTIPIGFVFPSYILELNGNAICCKSGAHLRLISCKRKPAIRRRRVTRDIREIILVFNNNVAIAWRPDYDELLYVSNMSDFSEVVWVPQDGPEELRVLLSLS
jgi:hypothetical protein